MRESDLKKEMNNIISKLICLIDTFGDYSQNHEKILKEFMNINDYKFLLTKGLTISEIHVIDCIGKHQLPNATFIAKELSMTKGAISKITAKLLDKGFIKGNHLEDNKKEIYLTLTTQGKDIFIAHEKVHDIENEKLITMLTEYKNNELQTISHFLDDLLYKL